jgi:formamidopyrimidine-DNA glycosylase
MIGIQGVWLQRARLATAVPELPDVERFRRFFALHAAGRAVRSLEALDPAIVRNATPEALEQALRGRRFDEPRRHGKWLVAGTDGPVLLLHFGMTGDLIWSGDEPERHGHDRLILHLDEGELRYRDLRRFGGAWLALGPADVATVTGPLGPDALDVSREEFLRLLERRRGGLKAALMDQSLVAGVGNLIADEVLWQARLHPRARIEDLDVAARRRLFQIMHRVLRRAVDHADDLGRERRWLNSVRGLPGATCPRCRTPLERTVAAGRTTYFCPTCQPPPDPSRLDSPAT